MTPVLAISIVLASVTAGAAQADSLPTRLYVRTEPAGARVLLDGRELGRSDGLFEVTPGPHQMVLELDGYTPATRTVTAVAEQITRVELQLVPLVTSQPAPGGGDERCSRAFRLYLSDSDLPADWVEAMQTVLRQHPTETRWSGGSGSSLFGLAAKPVPSGPAGQRALPALTELTHSLAVHELLTASVLLEQFASAGLTDATTLRQAVADAAGELHITGDVSGVRHGSARRQDAVVAYIAADADRLQAHLATPVEAAKVRTAYRDIMHRQARDLMQRGNWSDALLLWRHLHTRRLVSESLYIDAARCLHELGRDADALRVLEEAMSSFADTACLAFFEQAGDLALRIEGETAEALALRAYDIASARLSSTISPPAGAEDATDGLPVQSDE